MTRECDRCGLTWPATANAGRGHGGPCATTCPSCRAIEPTHYQLAESTTRYRLAIEIARTALRIGKLDVALAALDDAAA